MGIGGARRQRPLGAWMPGDTVRSAGSPRSFVDNCCRPAGARSCGACAAYPRIPRGGIVTLCSLVSAGGLSRGMDVARRAPQLEQTGSMRSRYPSSSIVRVFLRTRSAHAGHQGDRRGQRRGVRRDASSCPAITLTFGLSPADIFGKLARVAAGHVHVPARGHLPHPVQHAGALDVRRGARADVGQPVSS